MIHVSHLTRRFGDLTALDDVTFDVGSGEVVGILGLNGAGKTTLMRVLAGYLPATSGSASIAGFDVLRQSIQVRKRIGYLPEAVPLYREHRVVEMLRFQARLHGMSRADARRRIGEVLERVGLSDRRRELIGNLSRGLRQRAGLAVALLPGPEVLILDEPTSGLDPLQRIEVRGLVRDLAARHTVLVSSHILPEIEATCGRVVILHQGRIAADGTPEELVRRLLHEAHVRLEAVVGADVAAAVRLLKAIRGVRDVRDLGRVGIHHQLEVLCDEDLREDVGALAGARGWALRELSWRRPTLEQIFARIALGGIEDGARTSETPVVAGVPGATAASVAPAVAAGASGLNVLGDGAPAAAKVVYNLNPFDMGAARDLGRPKAVEGHVPSAAEQRAREEREGKGSP
jgi:ABC-2 type transport system ATP-binding protein